MQMSRETQADPRLPWKPQPEVQHVLERALDDLCERSAWLAALRAGIHGQTGELLLRRIDHLVLPRSEYGEVLAQTGFTLEAEGDGQTRARCPGAFVPSVSLTDGGPARCVVSVDSVASFIARYPDADSGARIDGPEGALLRKCQVDASPGVHVWVVERWGATEWHLQESDRHERDAAHRHLETFRARPRHEGLDANRELRGLFAGLRGMITDATRDLGADGATALFFRAEREYWVEQTPAAQIQEERHDAWGLGWANHDHHTYRCSRNWFREAVGVLELLGLQPREAFHAGAEAGWGAQVLEHPRLPFVAFVDVDLSPRELGLDFAHQKLEPRDALGTIGLWCRLHGEAMFEAGLHHLACHYELDTIRPQLRARGVAVMPPFSDVPELRQAFTVASPRAVSPARLERLRAENLITIDQADAFKRDGALGSHLELIERKQAYKGFHQRGIDSIIASTDPRS